MSNVHEILFTFLTSCQQPIYQLRDISLNDLAHFSKVGYWCEHADGKFMLLSQTPLFIELPLKSPFVVDTFRFRPMHNTHKTHAQLFL